jgi:hypothetical protein
MDGNMEVIFNIVINKEGRYLELNKLLKHPDRLQFVTDLDKRDKYGDPINKIEAAFIRIQGTPQEIRSQLRYVTDCLYEELIIEDVR